MTDYRQIGERHPRLEDMALLRGKGRFVDDLHEAGMLEAAFVRSPHAHAAIQGIDLVCARQLPGVTRYLPFRISVPIYRRNESRYNFAAPNFHPMLHLLCLPKMKLRLWARLSLW